MKDIDFNNSDTSGCESKFYNLNDGTGLLVTNGSWYGSYKSAMIKAFCVMGVDQYYDNNYIKEVFFYEQDNAVGFRVTCIDSLLRDVRKDDPNGGFNYKYIFDDKEFGGYSDVKDEYFDDDYCDWFVQFLYDHNIILYSWDRHEYNFGFIGKELILFDPTTASRCDWDDFEGEINKRTLHEIVKGFGYKITDYTLQKHIEPFVGEPIKYEI